MVNKITEKEFDVLPEFKKIWPGVIDDFAKTYKPEEHASPFLSFVDIVMIKCIYLNILLGMLDGIGS